MKETLLRILSAVIFFPILYFSVVSKAYESLYFSILIAIIGIASLFELAKMVKNRGYQLFPFLSLPFLLALYAVIYLKQTQWILALLLLFLFLMICFSLLNDEFEKVVVNVAFSLFVLIYLGLMFGSVILIKRVHYHHLVVLISGIWLCDIGAYFCGKFLGKHKLNLKVSPKKTLEGFIGGILFSVLAIYVSCYFTTITFSYWMLMIPFTTILGDLLESIFKRAFLVKDSSNIIPGHGGVLDVFDALIFSAPFYYYLMLLFS